MCYAHMLLIGITPLRKKAQEGTAENPIKTALVTHREVQEGPNEVTQYHHMQCE